MEVILTRPYEGHAAGETIEIDDHTAQALIEAGRAHPDQPDAPVPPTEPEPDGVGIE